MHLNQCAVTMLFENWPGQSCAACGKQMSFGICNRTARLRLAICLLLSIASWRGPIPMLHRHDHGGDPVQHAHHLDVCHSDESPVRVEELHWHFGFPDDVDCDCCPDSLPVSSDLAILACAEALEHAERSTIEAWMTLEVATLMQTGQTESLRPPSASVRTAASAPPLLALSPLVAITGVALI